MLKHHKYKNRNKYALITDKILSRNFSEYSGIKKEAVSTINLAKYQITLQHCLVFLALKYRDKHLSPYIVYFPHSLSKLGRIIGISKIWLYLYFKGFIIPNSIRIKIDKWMYDNVRDKKINIQV